jgi:hypothetical protein
LFINAKGGSRGNNGMQNVARGHRFLTHSPQNNPLPVGTE